jgi:hypothetical protein
MPFRIKILGNGAISGAATTHLFQAPASEIGAIVSNIRILNKAGSAATLNFYYRPSGGSQQRVYGRDYSLPAGELLVVKPEITMGPSDRIELVTLSGASLDYVVSGMERY